MKKEQTVLQEDINELVRLQKENPNARVMCFVADDCSDGDFNYQLSQFGTPKLETLYLVNETWVDDEEYVKDHILNDNDIDFSYLNSVQVEDKINEIMDNYYPSEKAIVIYIQSL